MSKGKTLECLSWHSLRPYQPVRRRNYVVFVNNITLESLSYDGRQERDSNEVNNITLESLSYVGRQERDSNEEQRDTSECVLLVTGHIRGIKNWLIGKISGWNLVAAHLQSTQARAHL